MALVLYFTAMYLIGAFVLFPVTIIMISSAFAFTHIWGFLPGAIITIVHTYVTCNIGFVLVFLFGRYLLHDFVRHNVTDGDKRFDMLRKITSKHGGSILALTRCAFIFPQNLLSYVFAVTDITYW